MKRQKCILLSESSQSEKATYSVWTFRAVEIFYTINNDIYVLLYFIQTYRMYKTKSEP